MNPTSSDPPKSIVLLIVDDDHDILSVTQKYLKTCFSYDVDTASSVDRAWSMIKETPYDAIIADYEMEGKNGIDLLNSIRSEGDETPFIIFTGKGREEVVIAAYESGADGYVQKGWDIRSQFAELAHKINTAIQKKQVEQAHKKVEQEYRSLYEEAPDAYFSLDNQWLITRCNIRAAEMMGIPCESLTTSSFSDLFPDIPEGKERIITLYKRFLAGDIIRNEELVIQRGDGTFSAVTVSISASYDESGNLSVSRAIIHDISDQKQAEITLQATRKSLDEAHKLAKIGIWDWEIAQERITWSEELYRITGWDPHTSLPPVTEQARLYTQESWQRLQTAVTHILDTGESYDLELQIIRPDRELMWVRALGEPVYDLTGNIIGLHGTVQDISKQKESEAKTSLHAARLHALLTLNQIAESSPSEILDYAIEASLEITGSRYSFFGLIDADEQIMTIHSWSKDAMRGCDIQQKPMKYPIASAGVWGDTIRKKRAQVINDYSAFRQDVCKWPKGHVPITRFVGAPICSGDKIVAIIAVANKPDDYQEDDVQSLTAFGNEIWRILNQKKAEESLQKSEERFRQLFNNASDAILLHEIREDRTPGKFLEVNDAACKKLGYTREELLALEVSDINTPQSNALIPEIVPQLFLIIAISHSNVPIRQKTGRSYLLRSQPISLNSTIKK
jgi:PAS domain S-box-containing protein